MVTVQNLVGRELDSSPVLLDMLHQGLLNISAVAERLQPRIEGELKRKVKLTAISMAIRRLEGVLGKNSAFSFKFPKNMEISTKSSIYEVAVNKDPELTSLAASLQKRFYSRKGGFLSLIEGNHEAMLLTNQSQKPQLRKALGKRKINSERNELCFISMNFEPLTKDIPGIYYQVTRALAFRGIPIQAMHTIGSEMIVLFRKESFSTAYGVISELTGGKKLL